MLVDGYCRYAVLKMMNIRRTYAYVGTCRSLPANRKGRRIARAVIVRCLCVCERERLNFNPPTHTKTEFRVHNFYNHSKAKCR